MRFPHGVTVTVLAEQRNAATGVITLVDDREISDCAWHPTAQASTGVGTEAYAEESHVEVRSSSVLYVPAGSALAAGVRLRLADTTVWEVDDEPSSWRSPFTGWAPGEQVTLKRVTPPV